MRLRGIASTMAIAMALAVASAMPVEASPCPPALIGGMPVGFVEVRDRLVPLVPVTYKPGGVLEPPATNAAAGISRVSAPLDAREGTSVITWHVQYGKQCKGTLNPVIRMPIGSTFTVHHNDGKATEYRISDRTSVKKGSYPASWFSPAGQRRLVLLTCGEVRNGAFRSTIATFAAPVEASVARTPADGVTGQVTTASTEPVVVS